MLDHRLVDRFSCDQNEMGNFRTLRSKKNYPVTFIQMDILVLSISFHEPGWVVGATGPAGKPGLSPLQSLLEDPEVSSDQRSFKIPLKSSGSTQGFSVSAEKPPEGGV